MEEYWLYNVHVKWSTGYTCTLCTLHVLVIQCTCTLHVQWNIGYTCTCTLHILIYRSSVKPRTATLELTTKPR